MKLIDIIKQIDTSKESDYVGLSDLAFEFDIPDNVIHNIDESKLKLKAFYIGRHYCTDQEVGIKAYFFQNEFVAISNQIGRKFDEDFQWTSKENYLKVKNHLLSFIKEESVRTTIIDPNKEMGEGYPVEYSSQLMNKKVLYKNKLVNVVDRPSKMNGEMNFHTITVNIDNTNVDIDIRDCIVPWNQKE